MSSRGALSFFPRGWVSRAILAILVSLAVAASATHASAQNVPRKFAGIVVDAKDGDVLYQSSPDDLRYPASVTKVMTLYILFQELAAGNVTLSTKMRVSSHAAAAVPTKLGVRSGSTITVEDAIKALVTLSANDVARVIAEHISGTESKFAERMTATARALGMRKTTYRNASGLPDSGQVTTVRDQSVLAIAVYQHFPRYYEYFQTRNFKFGSRTYGNHNRLLGQNGVDGIKTGFIRASGYNLMTAARTDGRHIVVIAFGFDSGGSRDARVRELVREYLPKGRRGEYVATIPQPGRRGSIVQVASATPVVPRPYPSFRLAVEPPVAVASIAAAPAPAIEQPRPTQNVTASISAQNPPPQQVANANQQALEAVTIMGTTGNALAPIPADRPIDIIGAWISESLPLGAEPAPLGQTRPSAPLVPPVGIGESGEALDLMTSGGIEASIVAATAATPPAMLAAASAMASAPPAPAAGGWVVQIGATPTESSATGLLNEAASTVNDLGSFRPFVERFEKNGQTFYRARFGGFSNRDDATVMCNRLKQENMSCLAMQG